MDWDKVLDDIYTNRKARKDEEMQNFEAQQKKRDTARQTTSDCLQKVVQPVFEEVKDKVKKRGDHAEVEAPKNTNTTTGQSFIQFAQLTVRLGGPPAATPVGGHKLTFSAVDGKPEIEVTHTHTPTHPHAGRAIQKPENIPQPCSKITPEFVESEVAKFLKVALS
jgi:hypothetical protein